MASARATIFSIAFRCDRCASRLFAAGLLLVTLETWADEGPPKGTLLPLPEIPTTTRSYRSPRSRPRRPWGAAVATKNTFWDWMKSRKPSSMCSNLGIDTSRDNKHFFRKNNRAPPCRTIGSSLTQFRRARPSQMTRRISDLV